MYNHELLQQRVALARRTINLGMNTAYDATLEPHHQVAGAETYYNCANLIPYLLGLDAAQGPNGEPGYSPSMIYADATGPQTMFSRIEMPFPGCLLVIPSTGIDDDFVAVVTKTEPVMGVACNKNNLPEPVLESNLMDKANHHNRIYVLLKSDLT